MRVLAFDSGAERMGWASIEEENGKPYYHLSGLISIPRNKQKFQEYRMDLTATLAHWIPTLIELTEPNEVTTEIIPAVGFNNSTQSYLANVAVSVVHVIALSYDLPVYQIGARSVHKNIALKGKTKKITKVHVRNGVLELLPELQDRKSDWIKVFDEPDAIANGLTHLGFTIDGNS